MGSFFTIRGCSVRILDIHTLTEQDAERVARILPERSARAERCRRPEDRLRCIGAGKLLIEELGLESEAQLVCGAYGKPEAPGYPCFSLSHSGDCVLIAAAPYPVGADIERVDKVRPGVARRVFTERELAWMARDELKRFHILWTQKEAVVKLDGRGLVLAPASFEMTPGETAARTVLGNREVNVESFLHDHDRYAVSIAEYGSSGECRGR